MGFLGTVRNQEQAGTQEITTGGRCRKTHLAAGLLREEVGKDEALAKQLVATTFGLPQPDPIKGLKMAIVKKRLETDQEFQVEVTEMWLDGIRGTAGARARRRRGDDDERPYDPSGPLDQMIYTFTRMETTARGGAASPRYWHRCLHRMASRRPR